MYNLKYEFSVMCNYIKYSIKITKNKYDRLD